MRRGAGVTSGDRGAIGLARAEAVALDDAVTCGRIVAAAVFLDGTPGRTAAQAAAARTTPSPTDTAVRRRDDPIIDRR